MYFNSKINLLSVINNINYFIVIYKINDKVESRAIFLTKNIE